MSNETNVLIIAEAGVNHNGSLELAMRLVDAASSSGADLIKFQTFKASKVASIIAKKADYQIQNMQNTKEKQVEMLSKLELSEAYHLKLIDYCKFKKIGFFSTAFDLVSLEYLASLGLKSFKIPSGEITNLPYLRKVAKYGCDLIISTGMATMDEIKEVIYTIEENGLPRSKVTLLHCTTDYPAPIDEVNLIAMKTMRDTLNVKVGYSDHTLGVEIPAAAVALGATIIEKHLTLDRTLTGPDHKASLEPNEFKTMVDYIRNIEKALGDGIKKPSKSEMKNISIVRKSIVAAKKINSGEIFTETNLTVKRPGNGISPMQWDQVIGKKASRNFQIDEFIEL